MAEEIILYPNCSEITWRLPQVMYSNKKIRDGTSMVSNVFETWTDQYPNGCVETMVEVLRSGLELDDLTDLDEVTVELVESSGGGGDWDYVERCLPIAKKVIKKEIDMEKALELERKAWEKKSDETDSE